MVKLLTRPTEPDLTRVEDDPDVGGARVAVEEITQRRQALEREQAELDFLLNPNSHASLDHRRPLDDAERITLHDRRVALGPALRRIPGELQTAQAALRQARIQAQDTRQAACRAQVAAALTRFYAELERVTRTHAEVVATVDAMNRLLHVPGQAPVFPPALLSPEFLVGGIHAERRRVLTADGWLAGD